MPLTPEVEVRSRRLVLENALEHAGAARVDPIVARLLATDPLLRPHAPEVRDLVSRLVADARSIPPRELEDRLAELGGPEAARARSTSSPAAEFPDLPGAVPGKVVLRLAPFPSGVLHVGHARMLFLNELYRERYGGRILLVFDDTIGSEEKRVEAEFYDLIRGDCEAAGVHPDAVYYKSDRIPSFYPWARRVIEKGAAYVCRCPAELLRDHRALGVACPERSQTPGEALDEWERMLENAYGPGGAVLRLKTDLQDPDPAFRDRVLFRISHLDHPRVGTRYRVWPTLEFSWAVDDIELGITHVLRGKDLVMEDRMQRYIWDLLGISGPPFLHWGILRVREAKVAKSKAYREIKSGLFDGWADPRTWSLRSLDRRGDHERGAPSVHPLLRDVPLRHRGSGRDPLLREPQADRRDDGAPSLCRGTDPRPGRRLARGAPVGRAPESPGPTGTRPTSGPRRTRVPSRPARPCRPGGK